MFKETLKQLQPAVYQTLYNALKNKQLSHCYLFVGDKGTFKKETAYLLAQSLVCEGSNPFACEECATCKRVLDNNYVDIVYIDGDESTIKIDQINTLQSQFEKTALEKAGKKVFIINNCENMTGKAANSLLKFIEEPIGEMTGIFIATQVDRVMKTIVSRCQNINFKPLSKEMFYQGALSQGLDELNAHFISHLVSNVDEIEKLNGSKSYNNAINIFCEFTNEYFSEHKKAILYLQDRFSKINKNEKNIFKDTLKYFLEISLLFVSDYLNDYTINDDTYINLLQKAKSIHLDYIKYMNILMETRDKLDKAANGLLLIDQMLKKLMEV